MTSEKSLHTKTRELLIEKTSISGTHITSEEVRKGKTTLRKISKDTGINYEFLKSFKLKRRGNPSVDKVQALYEHLNNKPLKV